MDKQGLESLKNYYYKWYPTQNQNFIETIKDNKLTLKSIYYENDYLMVAFYIAIDMPYRIVFKEGLTPYQVSTKKYFDKIDKNMIEDNNWNFFILDDSDKLDWYHKNGEMFWGDFVANHYAILLGESFIEVLAMKTPIIERDKQYF